MTMNTIRSAIFLAALAMLVPAVAGAADPKPLPNEAGTDAGNWGNTPFVTPEQPLTNPEHKKAMRDLEDRQLKEIRSLEDKHDDERMAQKRKHASERDALKKSLLK